MLNITSSFLKQIDKKFLEELEESQSGSIHVDRDPILPIYDIIVNAIRRDDLATIKIGIDSIKDDFIKKINENMITKENEKIFSGYVLKYLEKISKVAFRHGDVDTLEEIIHTLEGMSLVLCENRYEDGLKDFISKIKTIGIGAVDRPLDDISIEAINSMARIAEKATENELSDIVEILSSNISRMALNPKSSPPLLSIAQQKLQEIISKGKSRLPPETLTKVARDVNKIKTYQQV